MHLLIDRTEGKGCGLWLWGNSQDTKDYWGNSHLIFTLEEGYCFVVAQSETFDNPTAPDYDPVRCGVFADWLQDNEDRLLAQVPEEDRSLAAQRLSDLRDWLRSGFQNSA